MDFLKSLQRFFKKPTLTQPEIHLRHSNNFTVKGDPLVLEHVPCKDGGHTTLVFLRCNENGCNALSEFGENSMYCVTEEIEDLRQEAASQGLFLFLKWEQSK